MDPIVVNALNIVGRVTVRDPNLGNTYALYNADFALAVSYAVQFGTQSQGQTFGIVKSMFLDNGTNPSPVEVLVQGSDQFFTIPAYSIGTYTIDANAGSTIILTTDGGATDICTAIFYNWERPPVVWYSFGAFNTDRPIKAEGTMEEGTDVATDPFNRPLFIGGIDRATGEFRGVGVDALGRLDFSSTISIGGIFGADPMGAAPVNPGVVQAVLDSAGDIVYVELNADGSFAVTDANGAKEAKQDNIIDIISSPSTGTITTVASIVTSVQILAANANRKGVIIYNDSDEALKLSLANVDAAASWSVLVASQDTFILGHGDYTGRINGAWLVANGNARITEIV